MITRATLAIIANEAAAGSRIVGAPYLEEWSSRAALVCWLQWNDPNGSHIDSRAIADGFEPYDLDRAWAALEDMLADELKERGLVA